MTRDHYGIFFKIIQLITRLILPRYRFERDSQTKEPVVYVAHHQNMIGPISILAWLNSYVQTWVLSEFTTQDTAYNHYVNFTFTERFGWPSSLAKIMAWPASYLISWLTQSGQMIPVYRKSRKIVHTMKESHEALLAGNNLMIFPDIDYSSEAIETTDIYEGFLHLEKKYFKETGKHLTFIPVYSDQTERIVRVGEKIQFSGKENFINERKVIATEIRNELNRLADS